MKKIKIFLASSYELKEERKQFKSALSTKNNLWIDKGVVLQLDIWEDLSTRMSSTRSQDEYNKKIKECDMFVLLAYSKVGMYTEEEFEIAFGSFKGTNKPFIFTYFKQIETKPEDSLDAFKNKLKTLGHFYGNYSNFDSLWNQFNLELDRLLLDDFETNKQTKQNERIIIVNKNTTIKNQFNNGIFNNPVFNYNGNPIPKQIGSPSKPEVYLGREGEIETIHKKLFSNNTLLLVNGDGGIGKTTIASQYYHTYIHEYKHCIWYYVNTSIKDVFFTLAERLEIQFNPKNTEEENLNLIVSFLSDLEKPILFVIDNANKLEDLEEIYYYLRKFNGIHFLLTSRITEYEEMSVHKIKHIDKEILIDIFETHYKKIDNRDKHILLNIINAVSHNTLVIELIAKTLNNLNTYEENYSLSNLLKDLQEKGVLALSQTHTVTTDYKEYKDTKPEEIIEAMYDLSKLNKEEKSLLSVFAVLPSINIPFDNLKILLANNNTLNNTLKLLSQKGWLEYENLTNSFKGNTIVQEIVLKQNKDNLEKDTKELLENLQKYIVSDENGKSKVEHKQLTDFIEYTESVLNKTNKHNFYLYGLLGEFYIKYGNLNKAINNFTIFSAIYKELYEANKNNVRFKNGLAISYYQLAIFYISKKENTLKAKEYFLHAKLHWEELNKAFPNYPEFSRNLAVVNYHLNKL